MSSSCQPGRFTGQDRTEIQRVGNLAAAETNAVHERLRAIPDAGDRLLVAIVLISGLLGHLAADADGEETIEQTVELARRTMDSLRNRRMAV